MSVTSYRIRVLNAGDFTRLFEIDEFLEILKAWRSSNETAAACSVCKLPILFADDENFNTCCKKFYFKPCTVYAVKSVAVDTPECHFLPSYLHLQMKKHGAEMVDQSFLVLPDPLYWQLRGTLTYEALLNAIRSRQHGGNNHDHLPPPAKRRKPSYGSFHARGDWNLKLQQFYLKVLNAPLYHCSLAHRMQGKETFFRKAAIAKRAAKTARAMIVPAPFLRPNEIALPATIADGLQVREKWVIINRMPSLSPESFVALRVARVWDHDCIGIPCEILAALNADFDGDEINLYPINDLESQCECEFVLNSENNMHSFCRHLKLYPSQDMLVAHYVSTENDDLFPSLRQVYETEGSSACFEAFDAARLRYLHAMEEEYAFALRFEELEELRELARDKNFENFQTRLRERRGKRAPFRQCLETQVRSGAKGTLYHLFQLVGAIGHQYLKYSDGEGGEIQSSFFEGLNAREYVLHAKAGYDALIDSMVSIWKPGYNYFKMFNNMQNVHVDYSGRVKDGEDAILYDCALEQTYFEDVMSSRTFRQIFEESFE